MKFRTQEGLGRVDCVGKEGMCYEYSSGKWYAEGETWESPHPKNGQMMDCVCNDKDNMKVSQNRNTYGKFQ